MAVYTPIWSDGAVVSYQSGGTIPIPLWIDGNSQSNLDYFSTKTVTVNTAGGGNYTSLASAEAAERYNLTSAGFSIVFSCSGGIDTASVLFSHDWITDSTHFITINVPIESRHDGTRGSGYRLITNTGYGITLEVHPDYTVINGIAVRNSATDTNEIAVYLHDATGMKITNCLVYDTSNHGIRIGNQHFGVCANNIAYSCGIGFHIGMNYNDAGAVYNNTALNCTSYGIWEGGYDNSLLTNNYSGGSGTADYGNGGDIISVWTTNYSSDGSGTTTTSSIENCNFTNSTSGSEDAHINTSSSLIGVGTDLHADSLYPFNTDFEEDARPNGSWDVGADQYVSTPVTVTHIPIIIYNLTQQGFM